YLFLALEQSFGYVTEPGIDGMSRFDFPCIRINGFVQAHILILGIGEIAADIYRQVFIDLMMVRTADFKSPVVYLTHIFPRFGGVVSQRFGPCLPVYEDVIAAFLEIVGSDLPVFEQGKVYSDVKLLGAF